MEVDLPQEIKDFVRGHIFSVEQLEVLLRLHAERGRIWTAAEINRDLRSQKQSIQRWLDLLVAHGLADSAGIGYRYQAKTEEIGRTVDAFIGTYTIRPARVIQEIYGRPSSQLLDFARAFDLRKPHDSPPHL